MGPLTARARPLRPPSNPLGGPIVHLDATGSTNDAARALALAGAPDGTVVIAEEQTAGRGRHGRAWSAPRGRSLIVSVVARGGPQLVETLPLATPLAVCAACERVAAVRCAVKWPNDIWIDGRKVAGILIEGRPQEAWAVVGIGLNADVGEEDLDPALREGATSLRIAAGRPVDRAKALEALLAGLAEVRERSPESVLSELRDRDALYGRRISWSIASAHMEGEAAGIDEQGRLVVFDETGRRHALDAGEVHLTPNI